MTAAAAATVFVMAPKEIEAPKETVLAQAQPLVLIQGAVPPSGDYMTTPQGCTYRRTQAPGYPPRWILVLNPYHLGLPASPRGCKGMM